MWEERMEKPIFSTGVTLKICEEQLWHDQEGSWEEQGLS